MLWWALTKGYGSGTLRKHSRSIVRITAERSIPDFWLAPIYVSSIAHKAVPRSLQIPPRPDLQVASWLLPPPGNWGVSIHKQHGGKSARLKSIDASISHMKKEQLNDCANWDDHSILYTIFIYILSFVWSNWLMQCLEHARLREILSLRQERQEQEPKTSRQSGEAGTNDFSLAYCLAVYEAWQLDSCAPVCLCQWKDSLLYWREPSRYRDKRIKSGWQSVRNWTIFLVGNYVLCCLERWQMVFLQFPVPLCFAAPLRCAAVGLYCWPSSVLCWFSAYLLES